MRAQSIIRHAALTLMAIVLTFVATGAAEAQSHLKVGDKAPNIVGTTPDGKSISLRDLRGKVVLIDFWASWCGPCRAENPNVVECYEKYNDAKSAKGNGFEVFSVSLDMNKIRWAKAIESDRLIWPCHVSDLGGWKSKLSAPYGVRSIPSSFLIDKDGHIIAINLRGAALRDQLKHIFGK